MLCQNKILYHRLHHFVIPQLENCSLYRAFVLGHLRKTYGSEHSSEP